MKNGSSDKVAKKYGVPRVTLLYKVKEQLPIGKRMGLKGIFSPEQEELLVKWIFHLAKAGFPYHERNMNGKCCQISSRNGPG